MYVGLLWHEFSSSISERVPLHCARPSTHSRSKRASRLLQDLQRVPSYGKRAHRRQSAHGQRVMQSRYESFGSLTAESGQIVALFSD